MIKIRLSGETRSSGRLYQGLSEMHEYHLLSHRMRNINE